MKKTKNFIKKQKPKEKFSTYLIIIPSLVSFAITLLFFAPFILVHNFDSVLIFDILVVFTVLSFISIFSFKRIYSKEILKTQLKQIAAPIIGIIVAITLIIAPKFIKLSNEIMDNGNKWFFVIIISILITFITMILISTILKKSDQKQIWKIFIQDLLYYSIIFVSVIISGILWFVITKPII